MPAAMCSAVCSGLQGDKTVFKIIVVWGLNGVNVRATSHWGVIREPIFLLELFEEFEHCILFEVFGGIFELHPA